MAEGKPEKIGRDAFLYLDHDVSPPDTFAQCGPCRMFVPGEAIEEGSVDRCIIHGSHVTVDEGYSCGFMCGWPTGEPNQKVIDDHAAELKQDIPGSVTPDESGLVDRPVRCENCDYFDAGESKCGLYLMINKTMPDQFDLDPHVHPTSCCNANTAIPGPSADRGFAETAKAIATRTAAR